jgi:heme/copper-type cytochrome/quinol oxidase subunit 2
MSPTTIFAPASTPAQLIFSLSSLVIGVVIAIFVVVASLLAYAVIRFRRRLDDDRSEPPQVYGSNRVELAWTVIPILIVIVLFLGSARVITSVENDPQANATTVVAVGHQFWWEYRYPSLGGAVNGGANGLFEIDAERTLLTNQIALAQALTGQMTASVRLIKALGGGWQAM